MRSTTLNTARQLARFPLLVACLAVLLVACGGSSNHGFPSAPGEYPIQSRSVAFDGRDYRFSWVGPDGSIHHADGRDVQLVQDERSFLAVGQGTPVLHLTQDEPIQVTGRDREGSFTSSWFPFLLGYALGSGGPGWSGPPPTSPSYRYPPTDTFSRGDTLQGSAATTKPAPPDYSKVQPAPNAVSGQNSGTGAGTAASNRDPNAAISGQSGGAGSGTAASDKGAAISGQSGGTGAGDAASQKGGAVGAPSGGSGSGDAASNKGRSGSGAAAAPAPGGSSSSRPGPGLGGSRPGAGSSGGLRSGGRR